MAQLGVVSSYLWSQCIALDAIIGRWGRVVHGRADVVELTRRCTMWRRGRGGREGVQVRTGREGLEGGKRA